MHISFDNSYIRLPADFYQHQLAQPVAAPTLIDLNRPLAEALGLDADGLASADGLAMLAGNAFPVGAEPIAMAYAGHQFGHFVPQLGDGRAVLLGEIIDPAGQRWDLQLKGSGPTAYSRGGDGRSSIGPVVRELLASEAMAALSIPTTRALAAIASGETVMRNQPEPGGVLCRVARSHIRVGTFEYFARRGQGDAVATLTEYVIARHYLGAAEQPQPALALLEQVVAAQARLVANWMRVGFIHGVMNTDNCAISGETIDYGPFGFLDAFVPNQVYSSIDHGGRYAYNQQPAIAIWNLARLAECLLSTPALQPNAPAHLEQANAILKSFQSHFERHFHASLCAKIGLPETPTHVELALALLDIMAEGQADFTLGFRQLSVLDDTAGDHDPAWLRLFDDEQAAQPWLVQWRHALQATGRSQGARRAAMQAVNPAFILRNHLAQQAVDAAITELDFAPMRRLQSVLTQPFADQPEAADLALPPAPDERVLQTFCGT